MSKVSRGRGAQVERQWELLGLLLVRPRSRAELARELGVTPRTIRRDIDSLSAFFLLSEERRGREVVYSLRGGKPLLQASLTAPELLALAAGSSLVSSGLEGTPFEGAYRSALARLGDAAPPRLRDLLRRVPGVFAATLHPRSDHSPHSETVSILTRAALDQRTVEMEYWTLYRDEWRDRKIDPYWLLLEGGTLKLIGRCHWRKEIRIFSVDHMRSVKMTDEEFERPRDLSLEEWLREGFAGFPRSHRPVGHRADLAPNAEGPAHEGWGHHHLPGRGPRRHRSVGDGARARGGGDPTG